MGVGIFNVKSEMEWGEREGEWRKWARTANLRPWSLPSASKSKVSILHVQWDHKERAHSLKMSSNGDDMPDEGAEFLKMEDGEIADGVVVADLDGEGEGERRWGEEAELKRN